ncbi:MAG: hypothetical protein IJA68_02540 [Clostridia bacterium]|nr:hypothetical protein [Clostridia bacterium]
MKSGESMQPKKSVTVIGAVSVTAVLAFLRILAAPRIANGEGGFLTTFLFWLVLLAATALLVLSDRRPAAVPQQGFSLVSVGAVFTGVTMAFSAVSTFFSWRFSAIWPYPSDQTPASLSAFLIGILLVFSLLGGAFFVLQGLAWYGGKPLSVFVNVLALFPLGWVWLRVCQYEVSYYSSLPVMRHWYDLAMVLAEMLFFLAFARFVMLPDKPPRFFLGLSLVTGMLTAVSCVTRVAMALLGEQEAWYNTGLVTSADLGVCLLAFGFAAAYVPAKEPVEQEPLVEEEVVEEPTPSDDVVVETLTPPEAEDEVFFEEIPAPEEERVVEEEPPKPLELEDFILRLLQNPDNEQY